MYIVYIVFRYNYICPTMYNKAEFVLSILNSTDELDKINVNSMCKISSNVTKMYIKYKKFTNDVSKINIFFII